MLAAIGAHFRELDVRNAPGEDVLAVHRSNYRDQSSDLKSKI